MSWILKGFLIVLAWGYQSPVTAFQAWQKRKTSNKKTWGFFFVFFFKYSQRLFGCGSQGCSLFCTPGTCLQQRAGWSLLSADITDVSPGTASSQQSLGSARCLNWHPAHPLSKSESELAAPPHPQPSTPISEEGAEQRAVTDSLQLSARGALKTEWSAVFAWFSVQRHRGTDAALGTDAASTDLIMILNKILLLLF